jgi:hypothetical protein
VVEEMRVEREIERVRGNRRRERNEREGSIRLKQSCNREGESDRGQLRATVESERGLT